MSTTSVSYDTFSPRQIAGCQLWLDATDPYANGIPQNSGSVLSSWKDKSSNGFSGTAIGSPIIQNKFQNGLPVVQFNGVNQYINFGNVLNLTTNALAIFVVTKFAINPGNQVGLIGKTSYRGNTGRWAINYDTVAAGPSGIGMNFFIDDTNQPLVSIATNPNTQFNIFTGVNNRTSTTTIYSNGNLGEQKTFSGSANNLSNSDPLYIASYPNSTGSGPQAGMFLNGSIAEVIVYFANLSTTQRQQVEGYLAWKWGLQGSLPSSHPYKNSPILGVNYAAVPVSPGFSRNNPVFVPTQISGCQLWLDAADSATVTLSGVNITQLRDKSSSAYTFSNASGFTYNQTKFQTTYPSFYNNSSVTGRNLGSNTSFSLSQPITFFTVCSIIDTVAGGYIFDSTNAANRVAFTSFLGGRPTMYAGVELFNTQSNAFVSPAIHSGIFSTTSSTLYLNGTLNVTGNAGSQTQAGLTVGTRYTNEQPWTGHICEVLLYSGALSTYQQQQVEGYLAWKWGLQGNLPATHPFKNSPFLGVNIAPTPVSPSQMRSASWIPTRLTGCSQWLDATDPNGNRILPIDGTTLRTWADKSGNLRNVTQNASLAIPVFRKSLATNKLPGLDFTGGAGLISGSFAKSVNVTLLLVGMVKSTIAGWGTFWGHFPNGDHDFNAIQLRNTSGQTVINWHTNNNNTTSQLGYTLDSMVLYSCTMTNGNIMFMQQTNTSGTTSVNITNGSTTINTASAPTWVGRSDLTAEAINSFIYEIVYYQRVLSVNQRQQAEGYLAWKWGLASNLPNNHPYKNFPPSP